MERQFDRQFHDPAVQREGLGFFFADFVDGFGVGFLFVFPADPASSILIPDLFAVRSDFPDSSLPSSGLSSEGSDGFPCFVVRPWPGLSGAVSAEIATGVSETPSNLPCMSTAVMVPVVARLPSAT